MSEEICKPLLCLGTQSLGRFLHDCQSVPIDLPGRLGAGY